MHIRYIVIKHLCSTSHFLLPYLFRGQHNVVNHCRNHPENYNRKIQKFYEINFSHKLKILHRSSIKKDNVLRQQMVSLVENHIK